MVYCHHHQAPAEKFSAPIQYPGPRVGLTYVVTVTPHVGVGVEGLIPDYSLSLSLLNPHVWFIPLYFCLFFPSSHSNELWSIYRTEISGFSYENTMLMYTHTSMSFSQFNLLSKQCQSSQYTKIIPK